MKNFRIKNLYSGDLTSVYVNDDYLAQITAEQIQNIVKNSAVTKNHYRFVLLNSDETSQKEIPVTDVLPGGSFNENYQSGQRRSLSFSVINNDGRYTPSINGIWVGNKMAFFIGIEDIFGEIIWFKKGIYFIGAINPSDSTSGRTVSIELSDKFSIFEDNRGILKESSVISVGEDIELAIQDTLKMSLGNGEIFDPKPIIYHSTFKGKKVQAEIEVGAGGHVGEIISSLCSQINAEYFYDVEGQLNIIPIEEAANDSNKVIIDNIAVEDGEISNNDLSFDFGSLVNRICVIGSTQDNEIFQAVAVNDNPASPLCYQRVGYYTGDIINDSNITSDVLAQDRADYELRNKTIIKTTLSANTRLNPIYAVNNLIALSNDFYSFKQELFLINSISFSLDYNGFMAITCSALSNLPFFVTRR